MKIQTVVAMIIGCCCTLLYLHVRDAINLKKLEKRVEKLETK